MASIRAARAIPDVLGVLVFALLLAPNGVQAQSFSEGSIVPQAATEASSDDRPAVSHLQGLTIFTNRAAFVSAFPNLTLEDFEDLNVANGAVCAAAAPLRSTTNDACATPGDVVEGFELDTSPRAMYATLGAGLFGAPSRVAGPNTFTHDLVLRFTRPAYVAGFDIACPVGPVPSLAVEIYLVSGLKGATTVNCGAFPNATFLGFAAPVPIDRIEVVTADTATGEMIDNLRFGGGFGDDVVLDLGALGAWALYNTGAYASFGGAANGARNADQANLIGFAQLHPFSPEEVATGDIDGNGLSDIIFDFPGFGVWALLNNRTWVQLHGANVVSLVTGDLDGNGRSDVVMAFPGFGIFVWMNNTAFVQLHATTSLRMLTADMDGNGRDEVIIDFPVFGLYVWLNNTSFQALHPFNAAILAAGDLDGNGQDDVVVGFAGFGLFARMNNAAWAFLHPSLGIAVAAGDIDGNGQDDMVVSFPGAGVWVLLNGTWVQLHPATAENVVMADIDGNGQMDVIIDFGPAGVWAWQNNSTFVLLLPWNVEGMATGNLDGR